jgi:hypothetical protein
MNNTTPGMTLCDFVPAVKGMILLSRSAPVD